MIIKWHKDKYPLLNNEDLYLLIYESIFATNYLCNSDTNIYQDLYEEISSNLVRVNINTYNKYNLRIDDLHKWHDETIKNNKGSLQKFYEKLNKYNLPLPKTCNFDHSEDYKENYFPNYVIIDKKFINDELKYIQAYHFLSNLNSGIIALEGKCGAGKTTLSNKIAQQLNITIINIDDFFLPPHKKTPIRLNEVGGNIDYESIKDLLNKIKTKEEIKYLRYDCTNIEYKLTTKEKNSLILLEGVYSYHPYFNSFIDYLMFLDIDEHTQYERLKIRNNFQRFIDEWIPLENKYFDTLNIKYNANIII